MIWVGFGLLGSTDPPITASWIAGTADTCCPGWQKNHCNVTLHVALLYKGFQSWVVTMKYHGNSSELVALFCLLGRFPGAFCHGNDNSMVATCWVASQQLSHEIPPQWLFKGATTVLRQGEAWRITQCPRPILNKSKGWMWLQVNSACYIPWQRGHKNKLQFFFSSEYTQELFRWGCNSSSLVLTLKWPRLNLKWILHLWK